MTLWLTKLWRASGKLTDIKHGTALVGAVAGQLTEQLVQEVLIQLMTVPAGALSVATILSVLFFTRSMSA